MDFVSKLNTNQYKACTTNSTYLRIIAGAGTGKTRTLTSRIAYFILNKNIEPNKIAAITFTNKAAREMQERIKNMLSSENVNINSKPLITTFHSFCYRFLKREIDKLNSTYNINFTIVDEEDQNKIFKDIFEELSFKDNKEKCLNITNIIKSYKKEGLLPSDINFALLSKDKNLNLDVSKVYIKYQQALLKQNVLDFDDLIIYTLKILISDKEVLSRWQKMFSMYFVDEFQDTDLVQYKLIKLLINKDLNTMLTVVGDPDQTIYTWRGAQNRIIKNLLEKDFDNLETIILDENYRSTKNILEVANKIISFNQDRIKKDLIPASNIDGDSVEIKNLYSDKDEAYFIASNISLYKKTHNLNYSDFAILYRNNFLSRVIEKQLIQFNIPYHVYGGKKFFERKEIKDSLAYIKLLFNPSDDLSFLRILQAPNRGIGKVTLNNAKIVANEKGLSLFEVFKDDNLLKISSTSRELLNTFYSTYSSFLSNEDNLNNFNLVKDYLYNVGIENYIKKIDLEESLKKDIFSSNNERFENYQELLSDIEEFLNTTNIDIDNTEVKNTLNDYINKLELQSTQDEIENKDEVLLSTCHVAKGLEFKVVFVCGLNQRLFPSSQSLDDIDKSKIEEERRLFYVACTRAMQKLYISTYIQATGRNLSYTPSMFLKETGLLQIKENNYSENYNYLKGYNSYDKQNTFSGASNLKVNNNQNYKIGDAVVHDKFGLGIILDVDLKTVSVSFDSFEGIKKLIKSAPQLKKKED